MAGEEGVQPGACTHSGMMGWRKITRANRWDHGPGSTFLDGLQRKASRNGGMFTKHCRPLFLGLSGQTTSANENSWECESIVGNIQGSTRPGFYLPEKQTTHDECKKTTKSFAVLSQDRWQPLQSSTAYQFASKYHSIYIINGTTYLHWWTCTVCLQVSTKQLISTLVESNHIPLVSCNCDTPLDLQGTLKCLLLFIHG